MALALLMFLSWALWNLWSDLRFQSKKVAGLRAPKLNLTLSQAPAITISSTRLEVYLGRDAACDFHFDDGTLSARHARFQYHHGQWWLEDLHSSNGTYINDNPVLSPVVITTHDQLRFGELAFSVKIE
jgi:pSer/pThr/pTyr-binding forkhead associated (FHA) protein